ncbi:MAG TPA: class I SAM-dependent methyltransferase [Solirubrobacteraceae bacterium]|jgi:2-polyprenyl-3-methyl-5-hydroxy-6-metoxy-1,4-benzoquinol methylase|nr:class I SAM-dependent methyltransferase [Solirubrobacteraceae bacterium]
MRNILDKAPATELHGISLQATRLVTDSDLEGRDVLDIGCGFGWFELYGLARGVHSITGIEITERDLETARANVNAPNVRLQTASATNLPFDDASFDTVVCWEVLEHIPVNTEPQAFQEIARVLRPGGHLYLSTPHASLTARAFDPAWWLIGHRHYTCSDLERLARSASLSVDILETRGGPFLIASILNLYVAKWIFRRGPFYEDYVNRRVDTELGRAGGSAGCFMKATATAT